MGRRRLVGVGGGTRIGASSHYRSDNPLGVATTLRRREVVKRFSKLKVSGKKRAKMREANNFKQMTWEDKRALIELVFNGTAPDGRPMGIYVSPINGQKNHRQKQWAIIIRGFAPACADQRVTQCASR